MVVFFFHYLDTCGGTSDEVKLLIERDEWRNVHFEREMLMEPCDSEGCCERVG